MFIKKGVYIIFLLSIFIVSSISLSEGAILTGHVYNSTLDSLHEVIVIVDSNPIQRYVVKNSSYQFELPPGKYRLTARTFEEGVDILGMDVDVIVEKEGTFVYDLVLEPVSDTIIIGNDSSKDNRVMKLNILNIIFLILLICAIAFGIIFFVKWKQKTKVETKNSSHIKTEIIEKNEEHGLDEYSTKVLDIIKTEKRITQKEIRKNFDLSEAKISLIISELETEGFVKKIKKGRGNIIIYNDIKSSKPKDV